MTAEKTNCQSPAVSVLMAVYNGERFLEESIRSIMDQTFRDFEFLIVDDGSTDNSAEIVRRCADQDSRIVPLHNESNLGLTRSLNIGISQARGRYLARQDADDVSLAGRFERQVEYLENNPETSVLGTACEIIDESGDILGGRSYALDSATLRRELLIKNFALNHSSVMGRAEHIRQLGGYDESLKYAQDYDLWWRVSEKAGLANLEDKLIRWRSSAGQISADARSEQLRCMLEISLRIVGSVAGDGRISFEPYERLWMAINSDSLANLRREDIFILEPLWALLSSDGRHPPSTLKAIEDTAIRLYRAGNYSTAKALSSVLGSYFGRKPGTFSVLTSVVKSLVSGK